ncbi:hypothetical protein JTE90_016034 [Oedothorax gibbosus]|uniref:Uncharacterized protein n=1 Tax=Oedothorax gibbosus TaxID=931172 RepID=A0AAV6VRH2_9ARAC|nr:hypothetical protein JTE90_016034 [Oedothorax gibbosus]
MQGGQSGHSQMLSGLMRSLTGKLDRERFSLSSLTLHHSMLLRVALLGSWQKNPSWSSLWFELTFELSVM